MVSSVLVSATQRRSGKSMVSLGLVSVLERHLGRVGYFKPIGQKGPDGVDPDVLLMKETLGLEASVEDMAPVTMDEVTDALAHGTYDEILDTILDAYQRVVETCSFVVCEGTDYFGAMAAFEFNINADISKNLSAPILLVANGRPCEEAGCTYGDDACEKRCKEEDRIGVVINNIRLVKESIDEKGAEFFGVVINRVAESDREEMVQRSKKELGGEGIRLLGYLPPADILKKPYLDEIAEGLDAEVLSGGGRLDVIAQDITVAAMRIERLLQTAKRGALVVTAGDREAVLLGMASAYSSPAIPSPSGIMMTGGLEPQPAVMKLLRDISGGRMPLLKTKMDVYQAVIKINEVKPQLRATDHARIETVKGLLENNFEIDALLAWGAAPPKVKRVTPQVFIHRIMDLARHDKRTIVLPEGKDERVLRAAEILLARGVCNIVLLGNEGELRSLGDQLGLKLDAATVIDPDTSDLREPFARRYQELRAKKNPTFEHAFDLMHDATYFGTMMVKEGKADGMVSGAINTTAHTLRPALEFVKTKEGVSIASSVFFMCLPNQVLVYGDCAVNPNPTAEQLADIAVASADTAAAFDVEPYVAMISYSTGASGTGTDVEKVREATQIVKERRPGLAVEGPIQYDAAIDKSVAKTKLPDSKVAGAASVFIFPDLNTGNTTYKAVQRSANAIAIGPVMQGLRKPVNDLSRGCVVADIVNTVAITAIQAAQ
ncbi:MAG: phosphate acetyltransferase [Deltaproteobacteria bacterium]|nr:phosphate acetyltransferase [Deltaproteobacteria bacterium]